METDYDAQKVERRISLGRAYLAGPMTGIPQFNFPLFDAVAHDLRVAGWDIVSPAELDDPETREAALASPDGAPGGSAINGETWADFLARDVKLIADEVDAVILLPGWEGSKGARLEAFIASLSGHKVYFYEPACEIGIQEVPEARLHALLHASATSQPPVNGGKIEFLSYDEEPASGERPLGLTETRVINADTGGEKGTKDQRMGLLPWKQLAEVAEHYNAGALKYADHNWMKGYAWHLSFDAMMRHAVKWWAEGEELDEETQTSHLSAIVFHALALMYFRDNYPEGDDRPPTTIEEAQA